MQRALERGLNPLLSLLPLCLFGAAVLFDLGALISGLTAFGDIGRRVLATALLVGLVALIALFVDYATAPVGSLAHRLRGVASASTTGMIVLFTMAWYLRGDGVATGHVFVLELLGYAFGVAGSMLARTPPNPASIEPRSTDFGWLTLVDRLSEETAPSHR